MIEQVFRVEKNFEQEDLLKFHSVDGFEEGSYFEGSGEPCDSKDMELKHQRCVVRFVISLKQFYMFLQMLHLHTKLIECLAK